MNLLKMLFGSRKPALNKPVVISSLSVKDLINLWMKDNAHKEKYDNDMGGFNHRFFEDLSNSVGLPKCDENKEFVSETIYSFYRQ